MNQMLTEVVKCFEFLQKAFEESWHKEEEENYLGLEIYWNS